MPVCKNCTVRSIFKKARREDSEGLAAKFLIKMHTHVMKSKLPIVLEFGVARGISTCLLADAVEKKEGRLYSVDIKDCSKVIKSDRWKFIKGDDRNLENILMEVPSIIDGINLLYIDSFIDYRVAEKHIYWLLNMWHPYIIKGGMVAIHGIDSTPYKKGGRKENYKKVLLYDRVLKGIKKFCEIIPVFKSEYCMGSVGMAYLWKK